MTSENDPLIKGGGQYSPVRDFLRFSKLSKQWLYVDTISEMSLQISYGDTNQIWLWFI